MRKIFGDDVSLEWIEDGIIERIKPENTGKLFQTFHFHQEDDIICLIMDFLKGDTEVYSMLENLISKHNPDFFKEEYYYAHLAVKYNNLEMLKIMERIDHNTFKKITDANSNMTWSRGFTLGYAIAFYHNVEIANYIAEKYPEAFECLYKNENGTFSPATYLVEGYYRNHDYPSKKKDYIQIFEILAKKAPNSLLLRDNNADNAITKAIKHHKPDFIKIIAKYHPEFFTIETTLDDIGKINNPNISAMLKLVKQYNTIPDFPYNYNASHIIARLVDYDKGLEMLKCIASVNPEALMKRDSTEKSALDILQEKSKQSDNIEMVNEINNFLKDFEKKYNKYK